MTRVMDGVLRVRTAPAPVVVEPKRAVPQPVVSAPRFVVGMDGVRRPVRATAAVAAKPVRAAWRRPALRLPSLPPIPWRRYGMAAGLAATALVVSGATVYLVTTPRSTTASAEASAVAPSGTPSATPKPTPSATPQKTGLQPLLDNFAAANPGKFSIVVKDLGSGDTASVNADRVMESASLYKLFVADQIYHQIDTGGLAYSAAAGGGSSNTIQGCLSLMITISDNTCGRALGAILNWGAQNPALSAQGYTETDLATPQQTSARDVALLMEHLYDGTLNSSGSNTAFMNLLKAQRVNDRLPQGLPAGTVIAHKTGNLDGVVHDAGIVYGPKTTYLVVVMSGNWSAPGNAPAMFVNLSRQLWTYFED